MKKGQGSVAIVGIVVVVLIILVGVGFLYRNTWFGPVMVEGRTIIEKNTNSTTFINQTIVERDNPTITNVNNNVNNNVTIVNQQQASNTT